MKPTEISPFDSPSPNTDRRALSQAWFSALHLAQTSGHSRPAGSAVHAATGACLVPSGVPPRAKDQASQAPSAHGAARRGGTGRLLAFFASDAPRAVRRDPLTAAIVARTMHLPRAGRTMFALTLADGSRVQFLLRCEAGRTALSAICAGRSRTRVEAALRCAVRELGRRGVAMCARVVGT